MKTKQNDPNQQNTEVASPERMEKVLNKFEEEDGIEDEYEKAMDAKVRKQIKEESELDKNQVLPSNLGQAKQHPPQTLKKK